MRERWVTWVLAAVIALAGLALATAPFFDVAGANGDAPNLRGTVLDFKPTYGALLIATGAAIGVIALSAAAFERGGVALAAAAVAFVAGASLEVVAHEIHNGIVDRVWSLFELRGRGPWQAAVASLVAFFASLGLALTLARNRVDAFVEAQRQNRFDQYRAPPRLKPDDSTPLTRNPRIPWKTRRSGG